MSPGYSERESRRRLLRVGERDHWICQLCGQPVARPGADDNGNAHRASVDHIVPRSEGGRGWANLRLTHASCNEYRHDPTVVPYAPFDRDPMALLLASIGRRRLS